MKIGTADYCSSHFGHQLVEAITQTGFVSIENAPISFSEVRQALDEWIGFFDSEEKHAFGSLLDKWGEYREHAGFFPFMSENAEGVAEKNLLEYYQHLRHFDLPPSLSQKTNAVFDDLMAMAGMVARALYEASPPHIQALFHKSLYHLLMDNPASVMRILHYPPVASEHVHQDRNAAHEDIDLFTLLPVSTAPGLQLLDRDGVWHSVECRPGTVVANAGDLLKFVTHGFFPSTTHRVVTPPDQRAHPRYSLVMFCQPHYEELLRPGVSAGQLIYQRLRDNGVYGRKAG